MSLHTTPENQEITPDQVHEQGIHAITAVAEHLSWVLDNGENIAALDLQMLLRKFRRFVTATPLPGHSSSSAERPAHTTDVSYFLDQVGKMLHQLQEESEEEGVKREKQERVERLMKVVKSSLWFQWEEGVKDRAVERNR